MNSLDDARCKAEIIARIGRVSANSPRLWGKMTAAQMLCHLSDSYLAVMGERYVSPAPGAYPRIVFKWMALRLPVPWAKGFSTRPEIDQAIGGTPPAEFEEDKRLLLALIARFTATPRAFSFGPHPFFGVMSEREWMRWGYLHADHHLRQFAE